MFRIRSFILTICSIFLLTACSPADSQPVINNQITAHFKSILSGSIAINELYYEEAPVSSHYSGGIMIENSSRVWLKGNTLRTEQITKFYKNDKLLNSEISGNLYNYDQLEKKRYYIGQYPEQARAYSTDKQDSLTPPREQTILWYLDRITDLSSYTEEELEGEPCYIVEILKNNLGSTKIWISSSSGLPVKIQNNYNGHISERFYSNFKVGTGAVSEEELAIPEGALAL